MRHRLVDVALIVGLVAVAGGIMWTLFNLGGSPRPAPTTPAAAPSAPATPPSLPAPPSGAGVVPVDPNAAGAAADTAADAASAAGDSLVAPIAPDASAPVATPSPATPPSDAPTPSPAAPAPGDPLPADAGRTVAAADAAPVPSGTVSLERLGFSYVTGGAGACGIVLEPWQHVAVSRELLEAYGCGAQVRVTLDQPAGDRDSFVGVVADTMNPQFSRTANVYVGTDEDAFAYGLMTGSITPVE